MSARKLVIPSLDLPTLALSGLAFAALVFGALAAVPATAQPGGRRGPPPEAIEACADKSEGDTCSFTTPRGDVSGECKGPPARRQQSEAPPLACVPDDAPRR